ncbi:MAG: SIS domain-containing protein [Planctomycetes bacterium]|jgi:D-sedoheptulose 7-phosphate isomerase|nr:SIS domain-containing protein [Planctomycetota bacterium]MCL4730465.1 SIS domain-containing protein [Planctomycetota bacterium]
MPKQDIVAEFQKQLRESADLKLRLAQQHAEVMAGIAVAVVDAFRNGHSVWFCGNGGSFTDAHHIVGELVGRYGYDRPALPAFVLGAGVASMTAIANDYGYDQVFSREVRGSVKAGDLVIGLTTSGNSRNVCEALAAAAEIGAFTVALTGEKQAKVDEIADLVLHVPSTLTPRIQECHIAVGHVLCDLVEKALFPRA